MTRLVCAATIALFASAPAARAQQSRPGDAACAAAAAANTWQVPPAEPHGVHELTQTARIVFPPGTPSLDVELWGAGGGGGGGSIESISEGGYGGGGGEGGAYARATVPIDSLRELTIVVGRGGEGGGPGHPRADGNDGGATAICSGNRAVVLVAGGAGGRAGHANKSGGEGGRTEPTAQGESDALRKPGNAGVTGSAPLFDRRGAGGAGGDAVAGSVRPAAAFGGRGGLGATTSLAPGDGATGGRGAAVVRW